MNETTNNNSITIDACRLRNRFRNRSPFRMGFFRYLLHELPAMYFLPPLIAVIIVLSVYSCEPAHAQEISSVISIKDAKVIEANIRKLNDYQLRRSYKNGVESITIFQSDLAGKWKQIEYENGVAMKMDYLKKAEASAENVINLPDGVTGGNPGDTALDSIMAQSDYEMVWTYTNGKQTAIDIQAPSLYDGIKNCRVHADKTYDKDGNSQGFGEWKSFSDLI